MSAQSGLMQGIRMRVCSGRVVPVRVLTRFQEPPHHLRMPELGCKRKGVMTVLPSCRAKLLPNGVAAAQCRGSRQVEPGSTAQESIDSGEFAVSKSGDHAGVRIAS